MELQGKVALITGAAHRIGREIALTLAADGASVVIHFNRSRREAETLAEEIRDKGGRAHLIRHDFLKNQDAVQQAVKKFAGNVFRKVRHVDILVNNASIFYPTPFESLREKDWDAFLAVNLKVPFFLAREFGMKMFRRRWGKIVNLVDWTIARPKNDYLPYAISKAGLAEATLGLAKNLAPYVQVLSIAPGPVVAPDGMNPRGKAKIARQTLLKRFGSPRDVAETVRFFVEKTDYITGAMIPVDGGAMIA